MQKQAYKLRKKPKLKLIFFINYQNKTTSIRYKGTGNYLY